MAKKSGMSLNPGADATLVQAATNAAMANVPKDLSGTFESMASEYGKTMKIVGESFASAAKEVGKIGGGLVKKAIENQSNITSGDRYTLETEIEVEQESADDYKTAMDELSGEGVDDANLPKYEDWKKDTQKTKKSTQSTTIGDELRSIRKELSSLYLKTDKKSRARKNELRAQREQFSNDIKMLDDARNITDEQLKSGNVNFQNTGKLNLAFKQGMNALGTKTGIIDDEGDFEGYKLVPSRDKNGKMGFMLKDKKGDFVTGEDENGNLITSGEKPHFVSAAETKNLLEMNMDQKILDPLQKKINAQLNFGKQNVDYMGNQLVSSFRPVLDNETTLRQLSDVRLGNDTKTLREHVNGESEYSAEIFAGLSSVDLASMGVEDANKDGYIGDNPNTKDKIETGDFVGSDVAVSNFKKVRSATFDKTNPNYDSGSNLKRLTEKHIYRIGEIMHAVGADASGTDYTKKLQKAKYDQYIKSLSNPSEITIKDHEYIKFGNQNLTGNTALKVLNDIPTGTVTDPRDGSTYNWNNDGWYDDSNKNVAKDNDALVKNILQIMDPRFYGIASTSSTSGGENPFGGETASQAPQGLIDEMEGTWGDDAQANVDWLNTKLKGSNYTVEVGGRDKVTITGFGKTKTFGVDPTSGNDKGRANEIWSWLHENWKDWKEGDTAVDGESKRPIIFKDGKWDFND